MADMTNMAEPATAEARSVGQRNDVRPSLARGIKVTGLGVAVPPTTLTNAELESRDIGTNDQWIRDRTGIGERRINGITSQLALEAAHNAMNDAGISPEQLDLIILASSTPDHLVAPTAPLIAEQLGVKVGACDVNAACTGLIYGLLFAAGMAATGVNRILVIGSDTLSHFVDPMDRNTAILFGDGAGALIIEACEGPGDLLGFHLGSDGSSYADLYAEREVQMHMNGAAIFKKAVLCVPESAHAALEHAGRTTDDIDLFVLHQANKRIIDAALERLKVDISRTEYTLDQFGNTSTASIPLTIDKAIKNGRIKKGSLLLLTGFGAGMTSGSVVLRWSK